MVFRFGHGKNVVVKRYVVFSGLVELQLQGWDVLCRMCNMGSVGQALVDSARKSLAQIVGVFAHVRNIVNL